MTKVFKVICNAIFVLLIAFLATYFILRLSGTAEIYKVKTGSMEDGIHTGDYILVYKKNKYKIGDIVTYKKEGYHVTHRIIKKNGNKVITKGDANNVEDEETNIKNIVGKVIYNGGILNILIEYKYAIASALLALYLFSNYLGKRKEDEIKEVAFSEEILEEQENNNLETEEKQEEQENDSLVAAEEKEETGKEAPTKTSKKKSKQEKVKKEPKKKNNSEEKNKK